MNIKKQRKKISKLFPKKKLLKIKPCFKCKKIQICNRFAICLEYDTWIKYDNLTSYAKQILEAKVNSYNKARNHFIKILLKGEKML